MTDYNFLMESRLSPAQFKLVNELSRIAFGAGTNIYLVGGAVRDMTFGQAVIRDLDFAVEGDIAKVLRRLHFAGSKRKASLKTGSRWAQGAPEVLRSKVDKRRCSAELQFEGGLRAEIAQCRGELLSKLGRQKHVAPAMIFDDLKNRDFALNAMAISLHPNSRGLLLDPKNGVGDIERQEIRALHSRSFADDPGRIYRLFRLGLRLGFQPEEKTQRWLDAALTEKLWTNLAPEQQARELEAALREENPERVLKLYHDREILAGLDRSLTRIAYDRFRKVSALSRKSPGEDLFLLNFDCLVSKLSTPHKKRLAKKVLHDPQAVRLALNLERESKKIARALSSAKCSVPSQAYKLLVQQPRPVVFYLQAYFPQAKVQSRIKNYLVKVPQIRINLPESDLLVLGVKPGPKFDKILERIFFDQLDGKIKTQQQMAKELRSLAGIKEAPVSPVANAPARDAKGVRARRVRRLAGIARAAARQKKRKKKH